MPDGDPKLEIVPPVLQYGTPVTGPHADAPAHDVTLTAYSRSGPLPDSQEFARFDAILPGAANRILTMAELNGEHRREMERAVVLGGVSQKRWGLFCATVVILATLGVTVYLGSIKQELWGFAAVLVEIGAIAGAFGYSTKKNAEERIRKEEIRTHAPKSSADDKD